MIYLKKFNESDNSSDLIIVIQDIHDILLELEDVGFKISIKNETINCSPSKLYSISIKISKSLFVLLDIEDALKRLLDYLNLNKWYFRYAFCYIDINKKQIFNTTRTLLSSNEIFNSIKLHFFKQ